MKSAILLNTYKSFSIIILIILFFGFSVHAQSNLNLLAKSEWKGECRKVLSEPDEKGKVWEEPNKDYKRLQSSYSFEKGSLIWYVTAFADTACKKVFEVTKNTLVCTEKKKSTLADCKATSAESSKDRKKWKVDEASTAWSMQVSVIKGKDKTLRLTTISEDGEKEIEVLSK